MEERKLIIGFKSKTRDVSEQVADKLVITKILKENVHNLKGVRLSDPDSRGNQELTIITTHPSYNYNGVLQGLTNGGYIIK